MKPDFEPDTPPNLGKCCGCEAEGPSVRNVVMLGRRSPEPGNGCWGCLQCGLPQAGAVAVFCDDCLEQSRPTLTFCLGYPSENRRAPVDLLTEDFQHDMRHHADEIDAVSADGFIVSALNPTEQA